MFQTHILLQIKILHFVCISTHSKSMIPPTILTTCITKVFNNYEQLLDGLEMSCTLLLSIFAYMNSMYGSLNPDFL